MVDLSKMEAGAFIRLRSGAIRRVCKIEHRPNAVGTSQEVLIYCKLRADTEQRSTRHISGSYYLYPSTDCIDIVEYHNPLTELPPEFVFAMRLKGFTNFLQKRIGDWYDIYDTEMPVISVDTNCAYRIKKSDEPEKAIYINGQFIARLFKPTHNQQYYMPCIFNTCEYMSSYWTDTTSDKFRLDNGLIFEHKECAQKATRAMFKTTAIEIK